MEKIVILPIAALLFSVHLLEKITGINLEDFLKNNQLNPRRAEKQTLPI
jgi:hypothetical protein